jgi:hypothetical protein
LRITLAKSLENAGFTEGLIDKQEFKGLFKSGRTYWADRIGLPPIGTDPSV